MPAIATAIRSLAIILVAASCQPASNSWEVKETKSQHRSHQAIRLAKKPDNPFRGMELEFVRTASGRRAYLNVYSLAFPSMGVDGKQTEVLIKSGEIEHRFLASRLEGGQRLLLPEDAKNLLIEQLTNHQKVVIISGRFDVEVSPGEFPSLKNKL